LRASPFVDPDRELIGVIAKNAHPGVFETFATGSARSLASALLETPRFAPLPHVRRWASELRGFWIRLM
jgi:hypothetical protein